MAFLLGLLLLLCGTRLHLRVGEFQRQTYPVGYFGLQGFFSGVELGLQGLGFCVVALALRGVFGMSRLRIAENAACIISEGAAWIAHDRACLKTAKPVEILHADNSFVEIVPSGAQLPFAGKTINKRMDMYCVDPSDGFAKFLFARPKFPGLEAQGDERIPYAHISLPVDTAARPLFERLKLNILIDEDLIAKVEAFSEMSGERREIAIHDLEFGLNVGGTFDG